MCIRWGLQCIKPWATSVCGLKRFSLLMPREVLNFFFHTHARKPKVVSSTCAGLVRGRFCLRQVYVLASFNCVEVLLEFESMLPSRAGGACVSIRKHTSSYASIRQSWSISFKSMQFLDSTRQHTSTYVGMRQHTSAYVFLTGPCCLYALASCKCVKSP
jgi:hypothetical protein